MNESYVPACRDALHTLIDNGVVETAILCTVDGLPITYAANMEWQDDAIAAMSASMLALADAVIGTTSAEAHCRQVVLESTGRTVALIHAGENMVLAVAGGAGMNLGMVTSHARKAVETILSIVASSADHAEIEQHEALEPASLEDLVKRVLQEAADSKK